MWRTQISCFLENEDYKLPQLWKMKIAFLKLLKTDELKTHIKNVKKMKTMSCAGSPTLVECNIFPTLSPVEPLLSFRQLKITSVLTTYAKSQHYSRNCNQKIGWIREGKWYEIQTYPFSCLLSEPTVERANDSYLAHRSAQWYKNVEISTDNDVCMYMHSSYCISYETYAH